MREIQDSVTQEHQQFFVLASKNSRQRLFSRFDYDAFPHPLPELCLCRPKLLSIATDDKRCFLFAFLLPACCAFCFYVSGRHLNTPPALHGVPVN